MRPSTSVFKLISKRSCISHTGPVVPASDVHALSRALSPRCGWDEETQIQKKLIKISPHHRFLVFTLQKRVIEGGSFGLYLESREERWQGAHTDSLLVYSHQSKR